MENNTAEIYGGEWHSHMQIMFLADEYLWEVPGSRVMRFGEKLREGLSNMGTCKTVSLTNLSATPDGSN